jgi:hypothetical protein
MSLQRLEDAEQQLNEQIGSLRFAVNELLGVLQIALSGDEKPPASTDIAPRTSIIDRHAEVVREMHVQVRDLDRDVGLILSALSEREGYAGPQYAGPQDVAPARVYSGTVKSSLTL